jgi:hypothetical protein
LPPILILAGSPVSAFKLFNVLRKNGFPGFCPIQSLHLSCSREKEIREREITGAEDGGVSGTATVIPCAVRGAHPRTKRSSFRHQSGRGTMGERLSILDRALKPYLTEVMGIQVPLIGPISHEQRDKGAIQAADLRG